MTRPDIAVTVAGLRERVADWRAAGDRIALVPTMGALHEGHLELVRRARQVAERAVVSIFVNPKQFGPGEDFASYPRGQGRDRDLLAGLADLVFLPAPQIVYPEGFSTTVTVSGPSAGFEGELRPGHFAGVATVVAKLFIQCGPDAAVFGEKDWQQLQVVSRMTRDLDLPVRIIPHATVRDADGLALSSRNARLSAGEMVTARRLNVELARVRDSLRDAPVEQVIARGKAALRDAGLDAVDYLALVDAETLEPLGSLVPGRPARLLVAAHVGPVRLLDNLPVAAEEARSAPVNHLGAEG